MQWVSVQKVSNNYSVGAEMVVVIMEQVYGILALLIQAVKPSNIGRLGEGRKKKKNQVPHNYVLVYT